MRFFDTSSAFLFTAAALSASLAVPARATDGYFVHGIGAKAKGAGGAAIALPQEATSIAANPALATQLGHSIAIGVDLFFPDRSAEITGNAFGLDGNFDGNGADVFVLGDLAYVRALTERLSAGLAIYANGGLNTRYRDNPFAPLGATGDAGVDLKQAFIAPTLAYEFAEGHSIGVAPLVLVQAFRATGIGAFAGASADPANLSEKGTDYSTGVGVNVGYYGKIGEALAIGAFYQSRINASRFDSYAGLFEDGGDFDVPASWGAGIAVKPLAGLTLAADYKRIEYAGIGAVGNSVALLGAGRALGQRDGPGFGWRDIDVVKVGTVIEADDRLTLRAGYGHADNPVPRGETLFNILAPGVVQDHFTLGATYRLGQSTELSFHALHAPSQRVEGRGSIPPAFGGGEANVSLGETAFGIGLGFSL